MACTFNLRTDGLDGAETGGSWTWNGHSETTSGFSTSSGTDPRPIAGDNPLVDFSGFVPGFYSFTYSGGRGSCADSVDLIIYVAERANAGCDVVVTVCEGSVAGPIDMVIFKSERCDDDLYEYDYPEIEVVLDGFDDPGDSWPYEDEVLNIETLPIGSYRFKFTKSVTPPHGFPLSSCVNCEDDIAYLTINIVGSFDSGEANNIAICN